MNFVQILRKANDLKAQLTAEGGSDAWVTRQGLQDAYHQLLLGDLETALDKKLEQELWNHVFKNHISSLQHKARDRMNPKRSEVQAMLSLVLDNASGFYIQLLQEICSGFGVELACRIKAQRLGLFSEILPSAQKLVKPKAATCLYICQHCLVHLGDIARYRTDTQQAESFYCHAASLVPSNGQPYNQLAIVSATKGDQLSMVFYYIRSIAVKYPFPAAATNLQTTYAKLVDRDEVKIFKMKEVELIHYFIKFHAIIYLASCEQDLQVAGSIKDKLEENFRSHLSQEILTSRQLTQMAAINLYALHTIRQLHTSNGQCGKTSGSNSGSRAGSGSGELDRLSSVVDTSCGKPYVTNSAQCWTLTMGFSFNLLQMMLHYMPQKAGESPLDAWPGLPAVRLMLGWIFLQPGIFDDPVLTTKTSVWSKLGRVLTSLQVDSAPRPDDSTSSLPLPEDNLLDGFTPLQDFQRDLDFGQSKRSGWERSEMDQERCQRLSGQGKWLAHHQPSLLKVETSAGKLMFTSPLGDDAASRRSSHHQQRQLRATKTPIVSKGVEAVTKSVATDVKEIPKKAGRDGAPRRESKGEEDGQSKTIAVQAIMSRPTSEGSKSVTFKVQEKSTTTGGPSKSSKQTSTKDQDAPKRHVQWQNPPHAFAQEPSYFPQQKTSHPAQPQTQQQLHQAGTQTGPPPPKGVPTQQSQQGHIPSQPAQGHMSNQPSQGHMSNQQVQGHMQGQQSQGHMPHGHAPPPRHPHPQPAAQYPQQQGPPPPQHLPHPYGYPPPPRGPPPPSLGLPPDQRFPPPMGPPPPFPTSQNAPPSRGMPPGPPPPPHGHSGPPGWPQMPPHMDGGRPDGQQNLTRDDPSAHIGRDGMPPPPHMQPPKVQIPPPMPQGPKMSSPNSSIPHHQSHQQHPHSGWRMGSPLGMLERPEDRPSSDTMTNISLWNASMADNRKGSSGGHLPRGAAENPPYPTRGAPDNSPYHPRGAPSENPSYQQRGAPENPQYQQQHHQTSGMGSRREHSPMRSPAANSPQFRLSPSVEEFGMQQSPGMGLHQTSQSQPIPRRMSNPSEIQGFGSSSTYNQGQRNYMPSASMLHEQHNASIRQQQQQQQQQQASQLPGGPPPQILDGHGANLLELLTKMQKQIVPEAAIGKPGFPQDFQSDVFNMDSTNPPQQPKSIIKDPPGFSKPSEGYPSYKDHQIAKDNSGLGMSDYYRLQQELLKESSQGPSLIRSGPPGESAFRKVQPQHQQQQQHHLQQQQQRDGEDALFLRSGVDSKDPRNQNHPFSFFATPDGGQQEKQQLLGGESFGFGRNIFGQESRLDEPAQPYRRASGSLYETSSKTGAPTSTTGKDQPWGTNGREGGQQHTLDEGMLDYFPTHAPGSRSGSGSGSDKLSASFDGRWQDGGGSGSGRDQRSQENSRRSSHDALYTQMNSGANGGSFFSGGSGAGTKGNPPEDENVFSNSGGSYSLFSSPSPWSARQDEDGGKGGEGLGGLGLKWREPQLSSSPTSSLLPERIQSIWSSPVRSEQSPLEKILGHKVSLDQQKPDT